MKNGIDVSYAQGEIDWARLDTDFVMIRATAGLPERGRSGIDRRFIRNIRGANEAGIPAGAYHFSYALTPREARREAAHFLEVVGPYRLEYPLAFDFEWSEQEALGKRVMADICCAFLEEIEKAGYYAMLYSYAARLSRLTDPRLRRYDKWVAHVGARTPAYKGEYGIWQHSWNGRAEGIRGNVDLDRAYQDYPEIIRGAGLNHLERA